MGNLCLVMLKCNFFHDNVAKYYTKQIIESLKAAYEKGIIHKELTSYDLLLDEKYNIKIIGW